MPPGQLAHHLSQHLPYQNNSLASSDHPQLSDGYLSPKDQDNLLQHRGLGQGPSLGSMGTLATLGESLGAGSMETRPRASAPPLQQQPFGARAALPPAASLKEEERADRARQILLLQKQVRGK